MEWFRTQPSVDCIHVDYILSKALFCSSIAPACYVHKVFRLYLSADNLLLLQAVNSQGLRNRGSDSVNLREWVSTSASAAVLTY